MTGADRDNDDVVDTTLLEMLPLPLPLTTLLVRAVVWLTDDVVAGAENGVVVAVGETDSVIRDVV